MIEPTPEQQNIYERFSKINPESSEGGIARALRDRTAEVMRLEFQAKHRMWAGINWNDCLLCGMKDPCHAWTWPQWQEAAHERLMGGSNG